MPANLSIKNVPDDLHERLRQRAKANHRSLQGELLAILEEAATADEPSRRTLAEIREYARSAGFPSVDEAAEIVHEMRDSR
jgi:antitoxin FitA